jgi:hypothetical protein
MTHSHMAASMLTKGSPLDNELFTRHLGAAANVLIREIEGEAVILNLNSERYFGLDEIGTRMWALLTSAESVQSAYETLLDEYEIDAETLRHDLTEFIEEMVDNGLMELRN